MNNDASAGVSLLNDPAQHLKSALDHPYQPDVCFLCACPLTDDIRTAEHVLPKWLQERYDLWGQELVLINQTPIPYKQLKIPCCYDCNNRKLSPLEYRIRTATAEGYEAVTRLSRFDLFRWMAKIYLGILYKELSLLADRSNSDMGTILTPDFIRRYAILHFWLQLKSCTNDPNHSPGSLWVFRCQEPPHIKGKFDLKDDAGNSVIAIRMGPVAIIADFLENGVHEEINADFMKQVSQIPLHPIQVQELVALIVYEAGLLGQESHVQFYQLPDGKSGYEIEWRSTVEGDSAMNPWNWEDYARILSLYMGLDMHTVYPYPNSAMSWLRDPQGNFVYWQYGQPHPFAGAGLEGRTETRTA